MLILVFEVIVEPPKYTFEIGIIIFLWQCAHCGNARSREIEIYLNYILIEHEKFKNVLNFNLSFFTHRISNFSKIPQNARTRGSERADSKYESDYFPSNTLNRSNVQNIWKLWVICALGQCSSLLGNDIGNQNKKKSSSDWYHNLHSFKILASRFLIIFFSKKSNTQCSKASTKCVFSWNQFPENFVKLISRKNLSSYPSLTCTQNAPRIYSANEALY